MKAALILASALAFAVATPVFAGTLDYDVRPFTKARIDTSITTRIVVGGPQSIVAEAADPATLEDLRIEVVNGQLHAWMQRDFWDFIAFRGDDLLLTITVPSLDAIEANSSAQLAVSGMQADTIKVSASSSADVALTAVTARTAWLEASSSATILIEGTCTTSKVNISSSASIFAEKFECVDLDIEASSSSNALLFASGQVDAVASSSAIVNLVGDPDHVDDEVNSSADVDVL